MKTLLIITLIIGLGMVTLIAIRNLIKMIADGEPFQPIDENEEEWN